MTAKKTSRGKGKSEKLKIKKDTVRDLDVKRGARKVKGGAIIVEYGGGAAPSDVGYTCACTITCLYTCYCKG